MMPQNFVRLTGAQIRAARALIRWSAEDLAKRSKLGTATIKRAEAQDGPVKSTTANVQSIINTLNFAGVHFVFEENGGVGVILRNNNDFMMHSSSNMD